MSVVLGHDRRSVHLITIQTAFVVARDLQLLSFDFHGRVLSSVTLKHEYQSRSSEKATSESVLQSHLQLRMSRVPMTTCIFLTTHQKPQCV